MHRTNAARIAALLSLLPALIGAKCSDEEVVALANTFTKQVSLHNFTGSILHLLGPGENFGSQNRLGGGSDRALTMTLTKDESYHFRWGKDGATRGDVTCTVTGREDDAYQVHLSEPLHGLIVFTCAGGWTGRSETSGPL